MPGIAKICDKSVRFRFEVLRLIRKFHTKPELRQMNSLSKGAKLHRDEK